METKIKNRILNALYDWKESCADGEISFARKESRETEETIDYIKSNY